VKRQIEGEREEDGGLGGGAGGTAARVERPLHAPCKGRGHRRGCRCAQPNSRFCRAQLATREEGYCSVGEHRSLLVMPAKNRAAWPVFGRQSVEALKVLAALTSVSSSYSGRKTKGS
jgi:hypothetical protein